MGSLSVDSIHQYNLLYLFYIFTMLFYLPLLCSYLTILLAASLEDLEIEEFEVLNTRLERRSVATPRKGPIVSHCDYIKPCKLASLNCPNGSKFVIKKVRGVRKQFLIMNGTAVIAFVENKKKFAECAKWEEITDSVKCKNVDGLDKIDLESGVQGDENSGEDDLAAILGNKVNLTHRAHESYGYAELISSTSVRLTELFYDGAGPKTNWIVGTKSPIGVDSNTYIIDKLTDTGAAAYDVEDLSSNVPSVPAYNGDTLELSLPKVNGKQLVWTDVKWIALYCRQVNMLFMDVEIPSGFKDEA